MSKGKAPCCFASNALDRDKENYIRCSTRQYPPPPPTDDDKKGKKQKKDVCCSTAFYMKKEADAEKEDDDPLLQCSSKKKGKKGKKNKGMKEHFRCFTANMICLKLYMPGRDFERQDQLNIKANICKGCKPLLCSNRINVNCMPQEPSCQFSMLAECFEKDLEEGISLSVNYMKREIGRGCYVLPESVILRILNTYQEVVHTANVELTCKGCTVGMCTIRLALHMRCQTLEYSEQNNDNDDGDGCGCGHNELTDSNSQSFTNSSTDPCQGFVSLEPSGDSSNFCKSSESNPCRGRAGAEPGYKLVDMAGPFNVYGNGDNNEGCLQISAAPGPGGQFSFAARPDLGEGNINRMCPQTSAPKLKQMGIKVARECPVCHEDCSWLPLVSACPQCGYKQLPMFDEKDYDEKATARDILVEFFDGLNADPNFDMGSVSGCSQSGANRAADGKTSDGFDAIVHDYKALKQSIRKCKNTPSCPSATKSSKLPLSEQQTNLVAVFTELKKLFDVGGEDADKKAKIKEICDEACRLAKATKHRKATSKTNDPCGELKKRKRKPKRRKLPVKSRVYSTVDHLEHPRQGHAHCRDDERKVPAHMGWLWTQCPLAQRPGWRPGSIRRSIRMLMGYFLKDFPVDSIPISKYMSYHKQKELPITEHCERPEDLVQVPTLHIEKKNDEYLITLRPLKDPETLKRAANPYANMKPVQFRIVKNPLLKQVRELKRCLKKMGHSKCTCHRPVMQCFCRSFIDKKQLVDEVQRQCHKRQMPSCENQLVLSDTSDSEAEFDFGVTPPAGLMRPERLKVTNITNTETQYNENDWAMPTMFPHPPNAQVQYGGCVVGERMGKFPWIFGKGFVHRKPKPPKMRNIPKKKPKRPFPGAPMPREKGGFAAVVMQPRGETSIQNHPLHGGDHLQRLQRAAHPPTASQFQQSNEGAMASRKVRFDTNPSKKIIT